MKVLITSDQVAANLSGATPYFRALQAHMANLEMENAPIYEPVWTRSLRQRVNNLGTVSRQLLASIPSKNGDKNECVVSKEVLAQADLLHVVGIDFPDPHWFADSSSKLPLVVTIDDLTHHALRTSIPGENFVTRRQWFKKVKKYATAVVVPNWATHDLLLESGFSGQRLVVIPPGSAAWADVIAGSDNFKEIDGEESSLDLSNSVITEQTSQESVHSLVASAAQIGLKPYLLALDTVVNRQNLGYLLRGYAEFARQAEHNLVIATSPRRLPWLKRSLAANLRYLGLDRQRLQLVAVPKGKELRTWVANSDGFIDFGKHRCHAGDAAGAIQLGTAVAGAVFGPVEALAGSRRTLGKVAKAMHSTAQLADLQRPESAAIFLFDPYNLQSIASALHRLIRRERSESVAKAKEIAAVWDWQQCARNYAALYQHLQENAGQLDKTALQAKLIDNSIAQVIN